MSVYNKNGNILNSIYDKSGNALSHAYDKAGTEVFSGGHAISQNFIKTQMTIPELTSGTQAIACDSVTQSIAQLYTGHIYIIDLAEGTLIHPWSAKPLGHGDTGMFAPTKTASQDYPLLYAMRGKMEVDESYYTYIFEIQCTKTPSAELLRILAIPTESWVSGTNRFAIDFENRIIYHIYSTTYYDTAEYMWIDAWDMDSVEVLDGVTYSNPTPTDGIYILTEKLSGFTIPFVPEAQSVTFFDGLIAILSDQSGQAIKYVQFVDPFREEVYMTLTNCGFSGELEGIGFLLDEETGKYDMIVSQRVNSVTEYYRYKFI